jgi:hypothetical protein
MSSIDDEDGEDDVVLEWPVPPEKIVNVGPGTDNPNLSRGKAPRDPALPALKPKGPLPRSGQEAKAWARRWTDTPGWDKMIQFWIDNPEMMPPGVFTTIMTYRFGKPPQTVKVKGEIMARPYLGESAEGLALRAQQLADRLKELGDPAARAKLTPGKIVKEAAKIVATQSDE